MAIPNLHTELRALLEKPPNLLGPGPLDPEAKYGWPAEGEIVNTVLGWQAKGRVYDIPGTHLAGFMRDQNAHAIMAVLYAPLGATRAAAR